MESKTVNLSGVGDVLLERSRRAKYVNISVRPLRGVRVAVPRGMSFKAAKAFAESKKEWICKHLSRVQYDEEMADYLNRTAPINRQAARRRIIGRLHELADRYGFSFHKAFVRNQKTRWGSCSYKNNINLNVNLVRLPEHLMDYAILHELVHTRIKNHSPVFWAELEKCVPDARQADKELDNYRMCLIR